MCYIALLLSSWFHLVVILCNCALFCPFLSQIRPDGTEFVGDFRENTRGPFGVLKLSSSTGALYQGTWEEGLQDGVGVEVYADKGNATSPLWDIHLQIHPVVACWVV